MIDSFKLSKGRGGGWKAIGTAYGKPWEAKFGRGEQAEIEKKAAKAHKIVTTQRRARDRYRKKQLADLDTIKPRRPYRRRQPDGTSVQVDRSIPPLASEQAPSASTIDAEGATQRLAALASEFPPSATNAAAAPVSSPSAAAPTVDPPAPPAGPPGTTTEIPPIENPLPETPEVVAAPVEPSAPSEADMAFALAIAIVLAGVLISLCQKWARTAKPPQEIGECHEASRQWFIEGAAANIARLIGDGRMTPTAKMLIGAAGMVLSMVIGAVPAPTAGQANGQPPNQTAGPPSSTDGNQESAPTEANGIAPYASASGRFR